MKTASYLATVGIIILLFATMASAYKQLPVISQAEASKTGPFIKVTILPGTGSMRPTINDSSVLLAKRATDVPVVGDIILYNGRLWNQWPWTTIATKNILHRVVAVGYDSQGWYAKTKGDNRWAIDPDKVRIRNIDYKVVGYKGWAN